MKNNKKVSKALSSLMEHGFQIYFIDDDKNILLYKNEDGLSL